VGRRRIPGPPPLVGGRSRAVSAQGTWGSLTAQPPYRTTLPARPATGSKFGQGSDDEHLS
jgi:hypothetical protein